MRIIEIAVLDNGAHNNQTVDGMIPVPSGWAIIPDGMETPNFPFGEITVDGSNPPVVTSWTPGEIPAPEVVPEPVAPTEDDQPVTWKELDAAYQEGVDSVE